MLLTVREVARRLNVSASCVYQLISQGEIRCHRIGVGRGAIRVSPDELEIYLKYCQCERVPLQVLPSGGRKLKHLHL